MKKIKLRWKWILVAAMLCILPVGAYLSLQNGTSAETAAALKGDVKQYVEGTAVVKCKKSQTVYIESQGKIALINYNTGDEVKKGDLLLSVDGKDLELQLKDADARVKNAQSQLQGTGLASYGSKIEIARAAVEQSQISYDAANRDYKNAKVLYETGAISSEDFEKTEDVVKIASAALKSSIEQLDEIKNGAPDYLKNSFTAQLEGAIANRDSIKRNIDKLQVISPLEGTVLDRMVENNSFAATGTAAFVIGDVKSLELESDILSDNSHKVKVGDEVEISGQCLDDNILKGKVSKIAPSAKEITSALGVNQRRVKVTIDILGDYGSLKPGYNVDIKIISKFISNAMYVPDSAVFDYKGSSCVFVVDNGKTIIRPIKKGIEGYKQIEVLDGLKEGEIILTRPDNNIKEGIRIKPVQINSK